MFWTLAAASVPIIANNYRQSEADNPIIAPTTAPPSKRRIVPRTTAYESALPAVQRPKVGRSGTAAARILPGVFH
jgi:hypothetical protein